MLQICDLARSGRIKDMKKVNHLASILFNFV